MEPNLNPIGKLSKEYENRPIVRALLQLVPGWGMADTLLQFRAEQIRLDRLRVFFDELSSGNVELTEDLISSDDFLHSYFATLRATINTRKSEKIKLLARLLQSSLRKDFQTSSDEYEELLTILDTISLREFCVLCDFCNHEKRYARIDKETELQNKMRYWPEAIKEMTEKYDIPADSFDSFLARLERTGLFLRITGFRDYSGTVGNTTALFHRLLQFVEQENREQKKQRS